MLKWLKNTYLKFMNQDLIQQVSTYRDFFLHKQMQWIKPSDPSKLAKVVTVSEVFSRGRDIYAQLSDGSNIPVSKLNSDLMMITNDNPVMTLEQVKSINYDPGVSFSPVAGGDDPYNDENLSVKEPATITEKYAEKMGVPKDSPDVRPTPAGVERRVQTSSPNFFNQFTADPINLNLTININLPPMNLLKMMYNNAKDKDDFLKNLCSHINNQITESVIKESIVKKIDSKKLQANE